MKLWGGRFRKKTAPSLERLGRSIDFDRRLGAEEIRINQAYARGLERAGRLTSDECRAIEKGSDEVGRRLNETPAPFLDSDEDIHTAVERLLGEAVGAELAGKLPAGRSRNDLSVTGFRLHLAAEVSRLRGEIRSLQQTLLDRAEKTRDVILPGYTHTRRGQPVVFAQYLLSYFWALDRDRERFAQARARILQLPLGAGALAGNSMGVDREALAKELGFESVLENSIDAVSSRDFALEFLAAASILATQLSRMAEDLVLWSTAEFGFLEIDEAYATGSSLMPQKRNPDGLELIRGKSGRVVGNLMSLLTTIKGLPTGYQRDLQEDKEPVFDAIDTLTRTLPVMRETIATLTVREEGMKNALSSDLLATELADYLVDRGVDFRRAHGIVGEILATAAERGVDPATLDLKTLRGFSDVFDEDVARVWDFRAAVERKSSR
ncbi:MAG: argininosuccinate lyase, partial [Vicinamibacteria bacterium]